MTAQPKRTPSPTAHRAGKMRTVSKARRRPSRIVKPRRWLNVVLRPGEDGWTVAECLDIPGCISQGRTQKEAFANIREAIELCLEGRADEGWKLPPESAVVRVPVR